MSKPNDGGPAFPKPAWTEELLDADGKVRAYRVHGESEGMSLRDWFAAHVLTALGTAWNGCAETRRQLAFECYEVADAMLAAREKGQQ